MYLFPRGALLYPTIQPQYADITLWRYLWKIVLFYVFIFRKCKHNKNLTGNVHFSFQTSLLERGPTLPIPGLK